MQLFNCRGSSVPQLLLAGLALSNPGLAVPVQDSPHFRDPLDRPIDSVGEKLDPLPYRNGLGASVLGPWNWERSRQSPDLVRPPSTDHGDMKNMRWSFADSHVRIEEGGWTRQTTVRELGSSVDLASVNMRLDKGVIRELHWHKEAEWAYVLDGEVRITAIDYEGGNFIDDLKKGDLWYFPSGVPHSLQGLGENGTEFLLIFDDGAFSEESTFILSDWLAHTPKSVISKNFNLAPEVFEHLPKSEKYIFQGSYPGSLKDEEPVGKNVKKSNGTSSSGAGARVTIFGAQGTARTFDYVPGDVGIVPRNMGHFVENIGDEPIEMLEVFKADEFRDFSLFQWMGETPKKLVVDHLFQNDPKNGEIFWNKVKNAEKDEVTLPDPEKGMELDGVREL
ncbi:hypothetical protein O1611_g4968 [Lasiodiplodia mahajangana]|uniref:Uncharacterized protein n=1 Tax=Lasiodiplodia mahajangana TaxID=1108764 RepID=A0ACC2JN32_9PEZI|nr:hypothetical protein O1611_g4968 [Lasiodiplodia mahajangana]